MLLLFQRQWVVVWTTTGWAGKYSCFKYLSGMNTKRGLESLTSGLDSLPSWFPSNFLPLSILVAWSNLNRLYVLWEVVRREKLCEPSSEPRSRDEWKERDGIERAHPHQTDDVSHFAKSDGNSYSLSLPLFYSYNSFNSSTLTSQSSWPNDPSLPLFSPLKYCIGSFLSSPK